LEEQRQGAALPGSGEGAAVPSTALASVLHVGIAIHLIAGIMFLYGNLYPPGMKEGL